MHRIANWNSSFDGGSERITANVDISERIWEYLMATDEAAKRKKAKTMTSLTATVDRQKMANVRLRAELKSVRETNSILKDAVRRQ